MKNNPQLARTRVPFYQVDAFTQTPFAGNPAAVCLLEQWPDDATLQRIATENNLSETAFVVADGDDYQLRWCTPATEVDLCGHATLAAASVLFTRTDARELRFHTRSGLLTVTRDGETQVMNFPAVTPQAIDTPAGLLAALGIAPAQVLGCWQASDIVVLVDDETLIDALTPDIAALKVFHTRGVVVTAAARAFDFHSRWFGPQVGVDEDPVTGSAHTFLAPLWAARLGKTTLTAQQGGSRKGELVCELRNDGRVALKGHTSLVIEGMLLL